MMSRISKWRSFSRISFDIQSYRLPVDSSLLVLKPGFYDGTKGPFYCPDSAAIEGFLKYGPEIEKNVEVRRIDFQRPRKEVIDLLGVDKQGSPVLVLDQSGEVPPEAQVSTDTGRAFITDTKHIGEYLGRTYGLLRPH